MPRIWNSGFRSSSSTAHSQDHREGGQPQSSSQQQQQQPPSLLKQNQQRSNNFKSALKHISVPKSLFHGIGVYKVNVKGKLEPATLALSNNKFLISVLPHSMLSRPTPSERNGSISGSISGSIGGGLKQPSILTRGRSGSTSQGSMGEGSIGTMGSMDGDATFLFNPETSMDIGSIDWIQSGQNMLLLKNAR